MANDSVVFDKESLKSHLQKGKKRRKSKKQIGKEKSQRHCKKLSRKAKELKSFKMETTAMKPLEVEIPVLDIEADESVIINQ